MTHATPRLNSLYEKLIEHIGHPVTIVTYGKKQENVAIECTHCNEVLIDANKKDGAP